MRRRGGRTSITSPASFRPGTRTSFFALSEGKFRAGAAALKQRVANIDDGQVVAGLVRLVAAAGDPHTGIGFFGVSSAGLPRVLPVTWYLFEDGAYIVSATEDLSSLLGCRITGTNGAAIEEAQRRVTPYIAHNNDAILLRDLPTTMRVTSILRAAGLIADEDSVRLGVVRPDGRAEDVEVRSLSAPRQGMDRWRTWLEAAKAAPTLADKHGGEAYALEELDGGRTLLLLYNVCVEDPQRPLSPYLDALIERLKGPDVERLIIDLRRNGGGSSPLLEPLITALAGNARINQPDRLYVLIGRRTFSSASMNAASLKTGTRATLVGEPTGGSASHFGQVGHFTLPHSGLTVYHSTKRFEHPPLPPGSIQPDIPVAVTSRDYAAGRDPALEAILARPVPNGG